MSTHNICFHGEIRNLFVWMSSQLEVRYRSPVTQFLELIIGTDDFLINDQILSIFFLFFHKTYIVGTQWKHLGEALQTCTHNVYFHGEIKYLCGFSSHLEV